MSPLFFKIVIVGVPFGFSLMWFVYWVVKIYKEKRRLEARKAGKKARTASRR
jgi:hypothetical protein